MFLNDTVQNYVADFDISVETKLRLVINLGD